MKDSAPKGKWGIQKLNPAQIPDSHLVQFLVRQQRPTFQRPATGVSWTHTHNNQTQTQKLKHTNTHSLTTKNTHTHISNKNTLTQINTNIFKQHPTFYVLESRVVDLHTPQKNHEHLTSSWLGGGGVNPYGQPDCKKSVFLTKL